MGSPLQPGWYNDPDDLALARWHDGVTWTSYTVRKADWRGGAPPSPEELAEHYPALLVTYARRPQVPHIAPGSCRRCMAPMELDQRFCGDCGTPRTPTSADAGTSRDAERGLDLHEGLSPTQNPDVDEEAHQLLRQAMSNLTQAVAELADTAAGHVTSHIMDAAPPSPAQRQEQEADRNGNLLHYVLGGVLVWLALLGLEAWSVPDDRNLWDIVWISAFCGIPSGWLCWAIGAVLNDIGDFIDSFRPKR